MQPIILNSETLRNLQLKELDTLIYFKDFCDKHNLLFYFCGGCCIGSIRNKGFIPWDDDIDIFMPRKDYEKMNILWNKETHPKKFVKLKTDEKFFSGNIFTTIVDTTATCVRANNYKLDIPFGLAMDIFPLDGCPKGFKRKTQKLWAMIYSLFLAQVVPEKHGGVLAFGSKLLLGIFRGKKVRYSIWRYAEKKMSKYPIEDCDFITELCAGPHYMQCEYPKEIFMSSVYKEFEGLQMPIPVGYDNYLKIAFGDYLTLPPKDKQKPHHDMIYLNLTQGCYDFDKSILNNTNKEKS